MPEAARPLAGYDVLFEKELSEAARSKRMIAFFLIVTLALVLIPLVGYAQLDPLGSGFRHRLSDDDMDRMTGTWATALGFLGSLMVIASTVDTVSHERSLGVIAWVVTKPVSRLSYLLAKATAHALMACVLVVLLPSLVWLGLMLWLFQAVPVAHVAVAAAILSVEMTFLSFLVVSIGVPLRSVTPIAIIALALWFLPNVVPAVEGLRWTYRVLPSYLPLAALSMAVDEPDDYTLTIPLVSLALAAAVFALAVVRFERQEL